jgi:hypothetical protein
VLAMTASAQRRRPYRFLFASSCVHPSPVTVAGQAMPMSWKCPACQTIIEHDASVRLPRPGVIYRCYACRLQLVIDPATDKLVIAPIEKT